VNQGSPSRQELLKIYDQLDKEMHRHYLLPLETRLPCELRYESRDEYRITMTMILSQGTKDKPLAKSLSKLFKRITNFDALRGLKKRDIEQLLHASGIGLWNADRGGNGGRLWSFVECYFGPRNEKITEANVLKLYQKRGFGGGKFVRLLQAYRFGNRNVIPLDTPALSALRDPLFPSYCNYSDAEIRQDIESKLRSEPRVSLIDFHEMLRFLEQYYGKDKKEQDDVIIGWNAWRLLCSNRREQITRDHTWIQSNLVKDPSLATEVWRFYREITASQ